MSTINRLRYWLALVLAIIAIGLMMQQQVLVGIYCLITAFLMLPILYKLLWIKSNEVQFLSPLIFLIVTVFSYCVLDAVPEIQPTLKTEYIPGTSVSTTVTSCESVSTATSQTTKPSQSTEGTVYRTPSGKRYHYDPACGGKNAYEVALEDALADDLTPCKKCAGG